MDDALFVRGVDDVADALEQRHEPLERHRALRLEHRAQRRAADVLHRDPEHAVGLGAERVDVCGERMIEPRCELGLAQEPLDAVLVDPVGPQHLDDRLALEPELLREVDVAVPARADDRAELETAELAPG